MDASARDQEYLPKEPLDLPKPPLDLPTDLPKEIPAHTEKTKEQPQQSYNDIQLQTLLSWTAPGRPFKKRGKEFFFNSFAITLLVEIILLLFSQYMLMLVVLSLAFVALALSVVPPHDLKYRITTQGVAIDDHFYLWQELYDFYFMKRENIDVLHIRTQAVIPGEITLMLKALSKDDVLSVVLPYLPYREVIKKTFMEKSGAWLSKTFPLEKTQKAS